MRKYFFLPTLFFAITTWAQTKHALLFGIGDYPTLKTGWPKLSSKRDIDYLKNALLKQGFAEKNIAIVLDSSATKSGMVKKIKTLGTEINEGDLVFIHVSSHGEQVEDESGDETDGFDEAIVTYNAIAPEKSTNKQNDIQEYLRDDEFGSLIDELRGKLGKTGHIMVTMDLCHSGSGTRGDAIVRGGKPPFQITEKNYAAAPSNQNVFKESESKHEIELATYVVISAARADELDYETRDENRQRIGSLSFALSKAFENLDVNCTYRTFFSKIQNTMDILVPMQHPVLEGNAQERLLFGGEFVEQKPYFEIEEIRGKFVWLRGGMLTGLDSGAKVEFYESGTLDPSKGKLLSTGHVTRANAYTSEVTLERALSASPISAWAFVTEQVLKLKPIIIQIGNPRLKNNYTSREVQLIKEKLKDLAVVKFLGAPELQILKGKVADSVRVISDGSLFSIVKSTDYNEVITRYIRYKFLKSIQIQDLTAPLEIRLVPSFKGRPDTLRNVANHEFRINDTVYVVAANHSSVSLFFNIIDIQPDGFINPIFPNINKRIYPSDLKIQPGQTFIFSNYPIRILPPVGNEIFKVFVSRSEINLEEIANSGGKTNRGNLSRLEDIFSKTYTTVNRGGEVMNKSGGDGSMYNILFRIKP